MWGFMGTSGLRNLGLGLLWFLIGLAGAIVDYSTAKDSGIYLATGSVILFGLGQASYGLWQSVFRKASPVDLALPKIGVHSKALVCGAIAAAQFAGPLNAEKIALVRAILKQADSNDYSAETIEDVAKKMELEQIGIKNYLASVQLNFNAAMKQTIVRVCASVLQTDHPLTADDRQFLASVGRALDISDQHFAAAMAELPKTAPVFRQ